MAVTNTYHELRRYLNHLPIDAEVSRKEIISALDRVIIFPRYDDGKLEVATVDVYRRYLTGAGFLKHKYRGVYTKVSEIPSDLSISGLKKLYNAEIRRIVDEKIKKGMSNLEPKKWTN